jgi:hypothetical protein
MPVSARALISFKGLPTESGDGYIKRGEVFDVADQARYNYLASIGFVQDPNLPWGPGETTLPQIEERLPADLFQSGRPGYVQFKTIPEFKLSGSSIKQANVLNVTTAGTRVQFPDVPCSQVMIIAKEENTGSIFVGLNNVSPTAYGAKLRAEGSVTFPCTNANEIYIDASVSGEGVSYVAV